MSQPVLEVRAVSLKLQDKLVLDRVSMSVPFGAHVALVGLNGAGKTSLLQLMAGRLKPSQGQVALAGLDLAVMPGPQRAQQLAVVHQHEPMHGQLRVREYVALGRIPHGDASRGESDQMVSDALAHCRLSALQDRYVRTLSGGELQRAVIARVIAQQPRILLLDEPTNHLDLRTRTDMLDLLAELDVTVVAALHELSLVQRFARRVVLLSGGRVVADDVPAKVFTQELVQGNFGMDVFHLSLPDREQRVAVFESPERRGSRPSS